MSKDTMKVSRETVYSCEVKESGRYYLTVQNGIPITVEWNYDFNTSELLKRKIEASQPDFESAVKVCMSNLLKYNFKEFILLYKELKANPKSNYFYDIQLMAQEEYQKISIELNELELILGVEKQES